MLHGAMNVSRPLSYGPRVEKVGDHSRNIVRILGVTACPRTLGSAGAGLREEACSLCMPIRLSVDPLNYPADKGN